MWAVLLIINLLIISYPTFAFYQNDDDDFNSMAVQLKEEGHDVIRTINSEGYETLIVDNGAEVIVKIPVEDIIKKRPDLKEFFSEQLEKSNESVVTPNFLSPNGKLYTTVKYVYVSSNLTYEDPIKNLVWRFTNKSSQWVKAELSGEATATCQVYSEFSIASIAALEEIFQLNAGVKLSYTLTQSVTTRYGVQIDVAPKTSYSIYSRAHYRVYGYREEYWFFNTLVDSVPIGIFKPTGFEWILETKSVQ